MNVPTEIKISGYRDFVQPATGDVIAWTREVLAPAVAASSTVEIDFEFARVIMGDFAAEPTPAGRCRLEAREDGLYAVAIEWAPSLIEKARRHTHLVPAMLMGEQPRYVPAKFIGLGLTNEPIAGFDRIDWGTDV